MPGEKNQKDQKNHYKIKIKTLKSSTLAANEKKTRTEKRNILKNTKASKVASL